MKILKIDDKYSIQYDDKNNDRPNALLRYGVVHSKFDSSTKNYIIAMFYALLEIQQNAENVEKANVAIETIKRNDMEEDPYPRDQWESWNQASI